jgi:hypothetical protein
VGWGSSVQTSPGSGRTRWAVLGFQGLLDRVWRVWRYSYSRAETRLIQDGSGMERT